MDLMPADEASSRNPDSRWVWIREMKCGTSRFYTSAAFSRDIATWESIQQTWKGNKKQVKDLWMSSDEYRGYTQGFIHQISLHNSPDVPPTPTLMPTTRIRLRGRKGTVQVECAMCLHIVNLDHAYCFFEYFLPAPEPSFSEPIPAVQVSSQETMDDSLNDGVLDDFLDTIEEFEWNSENEQLLQTFEASLKPLFV
uniref:Uncharacterized protein n=1 Tax=Grammatophora oceanica TaxID=210454 RepID=A0A7S1VGU3_9STRA